MPGFPVGGWGGGEQKGAGPNGCGVQHPSSCSAPPVLLGECHPDVLICRAPHHVL